VYQVAKISLRGSIIIYYDSLKVVRRYHDKTVKLSSRALEGILSITEIKRLIEEITINVLIKYVSKKMKLLIIFQNNLPLFMIYQCDQKSK